MLLALLMSGIAPLALADTPVGVGETTIVTAVKVQNVDVTSVPIAPNKPEFRINILQYDLSSQVYTFPSGLRIIFQDDKTLPVVAITTVYDHGASEDPEGKLGLAHLMEHMWFRTEHGDLPSTWQLLDTDLGCNLNAFTQYDITAYMSVCPAWQLDTLLRLESLRMSAPLEGVTQEMVTTEEEVVRNEIRMRTENGNIPFFPVLEYINKLTYPADHPYSRPMAGDHTTIRNITLEDIQEWIKPRYVPSSTTVMAVGDLGLEKPQDVITTILQNFDLSLLHPDLKAEHLYRFPKDGYDEETADPENPDHWWLTAIDPATFESEEKRPLTAQAELDPRNTRYENAEPPPPIYDTLQEYESTVEDPTVIVTWSLPPGYQGNDTLMYMTGNYLSGIIDGNPGSPFGALEDPNIKEFGGCGAIINKQISTMVCTATLKDGDKDPERTAERIIDRLYLISNPDMQKFVKAELSRVRMEMLAGTFRSLDLYSAVGAGRATDIAQYAHFMGQPEYHSAQMNEAMSLQIETIADMVQKYVTRDRASMAVIRPLDREDIQEVSGEGSDHYNVSNNGTREKFMVPTDKITPELVRSVFQGPNFDNIKEYNFSNGLRVVVAHHGEAPVARATLISDGGTAHDFDGEDTLRKRFTRVDWEDPLQIAGTVSWDYNSTHESLMVEASAGNLDGMVWMLRDAVDSMTVDLSGRSEWIKDRKEDVVDNFGDMDWHLEEVVNKHINPDHPNFTSYTLGDYDRLKKVKKGELQAMMESKWQPSNATLLIVGNVDHDQALQMAKTYFGGWQPKAGTPEYKAPEIPGPNKPVGGKKVLVFDDEGKTQTSVELTCPAQYVGTKPQAAHAVLGTVINNELSTILRETSGVVYSPYAQSQSSLSGAAFSVMGAQVQNSAAGFTTKTYYELGKKVENGEFSNEQILQEKYSTALKYVLSQQSIAQMSSRLEGTIGYGRPWSYFDAYGDALANLDINKLQEAMGSCVDDSIVTLKGPKDEIVSRLDAESIAYEVVDWKELGYAMHAEQDSRGAKKAAKKRAKDEAKKEKEEAKKAKEGDSTESEPAEPATE